MSLYGEIFLMLFLHLNPFIAPSIVLMQLMRNLPLKRTIRKRKSPEIITSLSFFLITTRQRPTFPHPHGCSIIGPGGLNFRVRNGNGWNPSGMVTENSFSVRRKGQEKGIFPLTLILTLYLTKTMSIKNKCC